MCFKKFDHFIQINGNVGAELKIENYCIRFLRCQNWVKNSEGWTVYFPSVSEKGTEYWKTEKNERRASGLDNMRVRNHVHSKGRSKHYRSSTVGLKLKKVKQEMSSIGENFKEALSSWTANPMDIISHYPTRYDLNQITRKEAIFFKRQ